MKRFFLNKKKCVIYCLNAVEISLQRIHCLIKLLLRMMLRQRKSTKSNNLVGEIYVNQSCWSPATKLFLVPFFMVSLISCNVVQAGYQGIFAFDKESPGNFFNDKLTGSSSIWDAFKNKRLNTDIPVSEDCEGKQLADCASTQNSNQINPKNYVFCPDEASSVGNSWRWYLCEMKVGNVAFFTPYNLDFPASYTIPKEKFFFSDNQPLRLVVFMHPDDGGGGQFVKGPSSFSFLSDALEVHTQEESFGSNPGASWWGFSGAQAGIVANYNGRRIVLMLDYLLEKYPDRIDLNHGIYLTGRSLGGAGAFHQAMILPKYQDKIVVAESKFGLMMIPKGHKDKVAAWGGSHWSEADIRFQIEKAKNIHFHFSGGENDTFHGFDPEFIDICEEEKLSCSFTWLQSGHGLKESGYSLPSNLWLDPNQDVSLDKPLPVITNNSSNFHGEKRGYHNRGLTWNFSGIKETAEKIEIPLQYKAMKKIGPDVPDQPGLVSFSVTLRRVNNFKVVPGDTVLWRFGSKSGTVKVDEKGLITIDKLNLISNNGYQILSIQK